MNCEGDYRHWQAAIEAGNWEPQGRADPFSAMQALIISWHEWHWRQYQVHGNGD